MNKTIFVVCCTIAILVFFPNQLAFSHELEFVYEVEWTKDAGKIDLFIALPKSIEGRQQVNTIQYLTEEPFQILSKEDSDYAHFIINANKGTPGSKDIKIMIDFDTSPFISEIQTVQIGLSEYLSTSTYFDKSLKEVRKLAESIPYNNPVIMAVDIADKINSILTYSKMSSSIGLKELLRDRIGDCTEYADLFITIARIKNIPSRFVNGYFIHESGVDLHDWVEIYTTKYGWLCIDPMFSDKEIFRTWDDRLILTYNRYDSILNGFHGFYYKNSGNGAANIKVIVKQYK